MLSALILLEYESRLGANPTSGERLKAMSEAVAALGLVQVPPAEVRIEGRPMSDDEIMELINSTAPRPLVVPTSFNVRINAAWGEDLDRIGGVRCVFRLEGESDMSYRERLRAASVARGNDPGVA